MQRIEESGATAVPVPGELRAGTLLSIVRHLPRSEFE